MNPLSPDSRLTDDYRFEIGDRPLQLSIAMVDGKPRLSFISPTTTLHLATFRSEVAALAVVVFLNDLVDQVNLAITAANTAATTAGAASPAATIQQLTQELPDVRKN